jgi:putative Mg2+ transporter-C (MgtC) family protein
MLEKLVSAAEVEFILATALSIVAGLALGAERELRKKDAGISTHTLVILGAMLFTFLSMRVDPMSTSRIAAQIVVLVFSAPVSSYVTV